MFMHVLGWFELYLGCLEVVVCLEVVFSGLKQGKVPSRPKQSTGASNQSTVLLIFKVLPPLVD